MVSAPPMITEFISAQAFTYTGINNEGILGETDWNIFFEQYIRGIQQDQAQNSVRVNYVVEDCRYCSEPCQRIFSSGCRCRTPVHQGCFNRWIAISHRTSCEICGHRFNPSG